MSIISVGISKKEIEQLKQKNPEHIETINELVENDPSDTRKYVLWGLKQVKSGGGLNDILPGIIYFHRNAGKFKNKDINAYNLKRLEDEIKDIESKTFDIGRSAWEKKHKEGGVKLYEDDRFLLMRMDTKEACAIYGKGTRWCITQLGADYFEQYNSTNIIQYFLMDKMRNGGGGGFNKDFNAKVVDNLYKIAFSVIRDNDNKINNIEIFDAADKRIDELINSDPLYAEIISIIKEDAIKQPKGILTKIKDGTATADDKRRGMEIFEKMIKENVPEEIADLYEERISYYLEALDLEEDELKELIDKGIENEHLYYEYNERLHNKKIIERAYNGDIGAINQLKRHDKRMTKCLFDLARQGNETAIDLLDSEFDEMNDIIMDQAKKGVSAAIKKLSPSVPKHNEIILDLAKKGHNDALYVLVHSYYENENDNKANIIIHNLDAGKYEILNSSYAIIGDDKIREKIIELSKKENELAIKALDPFYNDCFYELKKLAKNGNKNAIHKLIVHLHNPPSNNNNVIEAASTILSIAENNHDIINNIRVSELQRVRQFILEKAKQGVAQAIESLNMRYEDELNCLIDLILNGNNIAINKAIDFIKGNIYFDKIKLLKDTLKPYAENGNESAKRVINASSNRIMRLFKNIDLLYKHAFKKIMIDK